MQVGKDALQKTPSKRRYLASVLLIIIICISFCSINPVYSQAEIPDEITFHYSRPSPVVGHCNPLVSGTGGALIPLVYEPLAKAFLTAWIGAKMYYIPIVAKGWRFASPTEFEIKIRDEVQFRDGSRVTADDVLFSIDVYTDPTVPGPLAWMKDLIAGVIKVDDKTIKVVLKPEQANTPLVYNILNTPIVRKSRWEQIITGIGGRGNLTKYSNCDPSAYGGIDGTGPYTLIQFERERVIMRRNPDYWGEKIGLLFAPEYFVFHGDQTSEMLFRMFDAHERDFNSMSAGQDPEWLLSRSNYLSIWNPFASTPMEWWMTDGGKAIVLQMGRHPVFREQWFRKALIYAFNFTEAIYRGLNGQALPFTLAPVHPALFPEYMSIVNEVMNRTFECTVKIAGISRPCYDPNRAIQILKEHCTGSTGTGWTCTLSSGEKVKLGPWGILFIGFAEWTRVVQVFMENLKSIGIEIYPESVDATTYLTRIQTGDYDMAYNWVEAMADPITGLQWSFRYAFGQKGLGVYWFSQSPFGFRVWWNGSFSPLPAIADQVASLVDKLWQLEPHSEEFKATIKQIVETVIPQIPYIPLQYDAIAQIKNYVDRWTNWAFADDYYLYNPIDGGPSVNYDAMMHVYPVKVSLVDFTLSATEVREGDNIVAKVTLRNDGSYEQRYKIVIALGPRKDNWELWHDLDLLGVTQNTSGTLAWKIIKVPPGTHTFEINFKVNLKSGEYTLIADPWRGSKLDIGKPLERRIKVLAKETPSPTPTVTETPTVVTITQISVVEKTTTLITTATLSTTIRETDWAITVTLTVILFIVGFIVSYFVIKRK